MKLSVEGEVIEFHHQNPESPAPGILWLNDVKIAVERQGLDLCTSQPKVLDKAPTS